MLKFCRVFGVAVFAFASLNASAETYTWALANAETGALKDGAFETPENWELSSGEKATVAPTESDDVVIPNSSAEYTVTVNTPFNIGSLTVGGGEGASYPTLYFKTTSSKNYTKPTLNVVLGDVLVNANATITHHTNNNSSAFYKVALKCKNLEVKKYGKISGDEKGSFGLKLSKTPNLATPGHVGTGSYGGVGGLKDGVSSKVCHGSIREPYEIGAAGGAGVDLTKAYLGGGAIYLEVDGDAVIDGDVSVLSFTNSNGTYNGSGGSIYIKAGNLIGKGTINASAGTSKSAGGGGGRISIRLSKATSFDDFSGTVKAYGARVTTSPKYAGCGTIYKEHAGDVPNQGQLIIDNNSQTPYNEYCAVMLNSYVRDRDEPFGEVIVKNGAYLRLPSDCVLKIAKKLKTTGAWLNAITGSKVEFVGEEDAVIEGANSFYNFSCTVPGKKLIFGTGDDNKTTIKANGYLTLAGSEENPVQIVSAQEGVKCEFAIGSGVTQDNTNTNLKDVNATLGSNSLSVVGGEGENCEGCSIASKIKPGDVIVWEGSVNNDWTEPNNWDRQRAPIETDVVLVPGECPNYPVVKTSITLNTFSNLVGGSVSFSGANLTVTNAFANFGTFTTKDDGIIYLAGDGVVDVDFGNSSYTNIYVTKTGGGINFVNGLGARYFRCVNDAPLVLAFGAGKTFSSEQLVLADAEANDLLEPGLELKSISPGGKWNMQTTENYILKGVKISDCSFAGGDKDFMVGQLAVDGGGNSGIDFTQEAASFWNGADGSLTTAGNWLPAVLPTVSTHVMISPYKGKSASVASSGQIAYRDLVVGGLGGTSTVKMSHKYVLSGGLSVNSSGTLKSDRYSTANEVSGNLWITRGGVLSHTAHAKAQGNTETYKISINVGGDVTINQGGSINVKGCGFYKSYGKGKSEKVADGSSYASIGVKKEGTPKRCYGSILAPFSVGSASGYGLGGGVVKLSVQGAIKLYGTINADGGHATHTTSTGGSIWLSAADFEGAGSLTASMGTTDDNDYRRSSGGRIALYKTASEGWDDFKWSVKYGGFDATGSYYRQDSSGMGELYLDQASESKGSPSGTEFPMADDLKGSSPRSAYSHVAVFVGSRTTLCITNTTWKAGTTVCIRDLNLKSSTAKVDCLGSIIKIGSADHRYGEGWTGGDYDSRVAGGTVKLGSYKIGSGEDEKVISGAIIWTEGFTIKIR